MSVRKIFLFVVLALALIALAACAAFFLKAPGAALAARLLQASIG